MRLLLVDDNQQNLFMMQVLLSSKGFQTELASNGAEALERARRAPPDMIISDILMPVMDGYSLCRACKADDRLKNIPFVFYTATYTDPKDEDFALSLGADRFIIKPVDPDRLLALILETRDNFEAGKLVAARQPVEETEYYKKYNAVLIRKLEDKLLQLEKANRILADEFADRKRVEDALIKANAYLENVFESSPDAIGIVDESGRFIKWNRVAEEIYGRTFEEIREISSFDMYEDKEELKKMLARLRKDGSVKKREMLMRKGDGSVVPIEISIGLLQDSGNRTRGSIAVARDLSEVKKTLNALRISNDQLNQEIIERKQAENALKESEEKFRNLFNNSGVAMFRSRLDGSETLEINEKFLDIVGRTREETQGTPSVTFWADPKERDAMVRTLVANGRVSDFEFKMLNKQGGVRNCITSLVLYQQQGIVEGTVIDITERKHLEQERTRVEVQLRQAQKMESLGTLAGGIAHDFNNILAIIMGYTEILLLEKGEGTDERGKLNEVFNAAIRAKQLVEQILAFSRPSEAKRQPVQVGLIVKEALKMLTATLPSTINVIKNVISKAVVLADPTQIHQILMNLCTNAAHAMQEDGGTLEVSLTDALLTPEDIPLLSGLKPGPHVKLSVKDTGCGISPAIMDRIFDPFFTTKEKGVGTGLGLSVLHGIVKSLGGTTEVSSLPGAGTTFTVFLPCIEKAPARKAADSAPLPRGRERVLVVDDEPILAGAIAQMLERLGYQAHFRTNGVDALEVFRNSTEEERFDLVITDMTMPHLTGIDLAKELLRIEPNVAILLCTGFSENVDATKAERIGIQGFLMKPVAFKELAEKVREVLDEKMKRAASLKA